MMRRVLILNVMLLAIVAVLVVQIVVLWWGGDAVVDEAATRTPKSQRIAVRNPVRPPAPRDLVDNIAGKDLFDATRAAAEDKAKAGGGAAGSDEPVAPLTLQLLGVRIIGSGKEALVKMQTQPKPMWFRQGEDIEGHKLERIDPLEIVTKAPDGTTSNFELNVKYAVNPGTVAVGPAGIAPTPKAKRTRTARAKRTPAPGRRTPSADIKAKIERLREEARQRRAERGRR